jgi:hypothetical protein
LPAVPVVDLYIPDDLPIAADADLGRAAAAAVDSAIAGTTTLCTVFVHRLPVYAVVSAEVEGVRTVRVHLSCEASRGADLAPVLDDVVRAYLRSLGCALPTQVTVTVQSVTETNAVTWPRAVSGVAV